MENDQHPGRRAFTTLPQLPQFGIRPSPFGEGAPKYAPYNATIAAGNDQTFSADFVVEAWIFAVIAAASVRVAASPGDSPVGPVLLFGGGGHGIIPGDGTASFSIRNTGSNPVTVVAIATMGYAWQLDYDPGDLA